MKPRIFIGSSVEGLDVAYGIQQNLEHDGYSRVWSQGVFDLSSYPILDLLSEIRKSNFAIFVFSPDDILKLRGNEFKSIRDNVIFEMGLCIGHLGIENVFFVVPSNNSDLHLPSDLTGLKPGKYDTTHPELIAALGPFCNEVRKNLKAFTAKAKADELSQTDSVKLPIIDIAENNYNESHRDLDIKVFEKLKIILPFNGTISFIKNNNFAGFPFVDEFLVDIEKFEHTLTDPNFEFIDSQLEELKVNLGVYIKEFNGLIAVNTWPLKGNSDYQTVPPEWEYEQPERFEKVVNNIHNTAKEICTTYDRLIKLARRKLGVL